VLFFVFVCLCNDLATDWIWIVVGWVCLIVSGMDLQVPDLLIQVELIHVLSDCMCELSIVVLYVFIKFLLV
ncbi:MAG: hypothetical protein ACKPKO_54020, partial [Candidatus Fonsibacter sp.]